MPKNSMKKYVEHLDGIDPAHLTAAAREKLDQAQGTYAEYREGKISEEKASEALRKACEDPDLKEARH